MDNELQDVASQIDNFKNSVIQLIQAQGFEFRRKPTKDGSIVVEAFPKFITPKLDSIPKMLRAIKILRLDKNPVINSTFASMTEAINNAKTNIFRRKEMIAKVETSNKEIEIIFKELPNRRKDNKVNEKEVKKDIIEEKKDAKLEKIVKDMVANLEALEDTKEYKKKCKKYDLGKKDINFQNLSSDYIISYVLTPKELFDTNVKPEELSNTNAKNTTFKDPKNPQPPHYQNF
jgi:hypothetical protein